jgi:hypothetical protein
MKCLREEIGWRILRMNENEILGDVTDDILKLIEKMIDDEITKVEDEFFGFHTVLTARLDELKRLKEELLK